MTCFEGVEKSLLATDGHPKSTGIKLRKRGGNGGET